MTRASHKFQRRGLNPLDENGNEGCAFCGRPRDVHPQPATAQTPAQAAYEAYMIPGESDWSELDTVEREHWEAIAGAALAAQERPATGERERRALEAILREIEALDEPGPIADVIRLEAMRGLGEDIGDALDGDPGPQPAPDLGTAWRLLDETRARLAVAEAERNDLRQALDERNAQLDAFTHHVIDSHALARVAAALREQAGMTSIDEFSKPEA